MTIAPSSVADPFSGDDITRLPNVRFARGGHSEIVEELDGLVVIGDTLAIERRAGRQEARGRQDRREPTDPF